MPSTRSRAGGTRTTQAAAPTADPGLIEAPPSERALPVLALRDVVFFPNVIMPLLIGRRSSLGALDEAALVNGDIFLVAQRDPSDEEPEPPHPGGVHSPKDDIGPNDAIHDGTPPPRPHNAGSGPE